MNILFIVVGIISIVYIFKTVKNGKFSVNESIFWICGGILILILSIFPKIIDFLALKLGIDYPPSLLFMICNIFLIFMCFRNNRRIAEQQEKIIELAQQLTLLKSKDGNK
ncbi:MAG: DUF2304 domain-containing protein [Bacilli bacterium]|nr:DUF2304 domain-containing protein [Bacilli bacterium]